MKRRGMGRFFGLVACLILLPLFVVPRLSFSAERLVGFYSALTMSMSVPWIAQEAGLFRKHNLDFRLVYIVTTPLVTSAMLGGEGDVALTGGRESCTLGFAGGT